MANPMDDQSMVSLPFSTYCSRPEDINHRVPPYKNMNRAMTPQKPTIILIILPIKSAGSSVLRKFGKSY